LAFRGETPSRRIAMIWRKSSAMTPFFKKLAEIFKELPPKLFNGKGAAIAGSVAAITKPVKKTVPQRR
jgi:LysR family hydrogen peroxide-inducible transcriptional activator